MAATWACTHCMDQVVYDPDVPEQLAWLEQHGQLHEAAHAPVIEAHGGDHEIARLHITHPALCAASCGIPTEGNDS